MGNATQVRLYASNALEQGDQALTRYASHLDALETARAARFVFEKHRRRFIAAHGFLREALARELGGTAKAFEFETGRFGKPRVKHSALHFSLTHTGEHALLAVSDSELGLDAEEIRAARVDDALARRVMTAEEFESWSQAAREAQLSAFFRLWSAKESVMKASGQGMELGPQSFAVYRPGTLEVGACVNVQDRAWLVRTLPSPPEFALALASQGEVDVARVDLT